MDALPAVTMNDVEDAPQDDRSVGRLRGPLDGRRGGPLETSVQIYDLDETGCFVTSQHEQPQGVEVELRLDLGNAVWITTKATTVSSHPGFGFVVRFTEMTDAHRTRLERAVAKRSESNDPAAS